MKKSCLYYWFIEPLKSEYNDDGSQNPVFEIPVETQFGKCELALFLDSVGQPSWVRFKIPGFTGEELKQRHLELLQVVKEHLLSILRLMYWPKIQVAPFTIWAFPEDGKPYSYGITLDQLRAQWPSFPATAVRKAFVGTWSKRIDIKLLADALDEQIALQYRYLSLYKILENHFKKHGRWQDSELGEFLKQFSTEFGKMNIHMALINYIHALRDKCAHVKSKRDVLGVTQLSQRQTVEVGKFLPFMTTMCIALLNETSKGQFTLRQIEQQTSDKNSNSLKFN